MTTPAPKTHGTGEYMSFLEQRVAELENKLDKDSQAFELECKKAEIESLRTKMTNWQKGIPPDSRPVLAVTISKVAGSLRKRRQIVRAQYIHYQKIEADQLDDIGVIEEYNEEQDRYWIKEGWYELIEYWEDYGYIAIDDPVIAWCKMPELPEEMTDANK